MSGKKESVHPNFLHLDMSNMNIQLQFERILFALQIKM